MAEQKKALRKELRKQREERFIDGTWIHILESRELLGATHVASYISYGVEPQTRDLNHELLNRGITVLVPRLLPDKDLEWVVWNGEAEPLGQEFTDLERINVVVIPALRVDQNGYRLGQGGGSYDRALPRLNAWKIALLHHGELTSENLPHEIHDAKINAAATPETIVRFS